ncbi:hypothetical protein [Mesorhizobium sp. M3A.F.Ca.ET.201.01.1.1]|uniref:hypothetical protein n=1 Tax=Mesorhizobium sp. M3A.F.Ca.ET.201.01.1.1 TaxID=2563946 RepID=UPI001FF074CD|nr:hypothetical protein [Mesorhizobium sp. M3A.F.Ca.ET.201.01.1.1]
MVSNNYPLLLDAAVKRQGVVLGWSHLIRSLVDEGALCVLFDAPLRIDRGYYMKVNRASQDKPHVQEFIDFVLTNLSEQEGQSAGAISSQGP